MGPSCPATIRSICNGCKLTDTDPPSGHPVAAARLPIAGDGRVPVIAEVGVNHEGDLDQLDRMVDAFFAAGADIVKLQGFTPSRYHALSTPQRRETAERFFLPPDRFRAIVRRHGEAGRLVFASALTEDWVETIAAASGLIKIASGDLDFRPVIEAAARSGCPTLLSTGAGTVEEIDRAVGWFAAAAGTGDLAEKLMLMHCVSAYPTPPAEANLLAIPFLAERYGLAVGYSNHVPGLEAPLAAVALGAAALEVHVTDRREGRTFRDHHLSLEPHELAELVRRAPVVASLRGRFGKTVQPAEAGMVPAIRKGIVAARDLAAGQVLAADDIAFARPGGEFAGWEAATLVGRRLSAAVAAGHPLPRAAVED